MTRQEVIERLKSIKSLVDKYDDVMALREAIKALEQEPVLDKIRAEIAEYKDDKVIHDERNEMIDIVLDIIDKYKVESEEQE